MFLCPGAEMGAGFAEVTRGVIRMSMVNHYGREVTKYLPPLTILHECSDSENGMHIENTIQVYSNAAKAAKNLEGAFIGEMISHMMPKSSGSGFSGGVGEEQFASFLNREYAAALSSSLDLGLKVGRHG